MSKSKTPFLEDPELQKLTLSPTNTIEDSNLIYSAMNKDDQSFTSPVSSQVKNLSKSMPSASDKKKIEKSQSGPAAGNRIPSLKLSSPNSQGYSRVNHVSEKKQDTKKTERSPSFVPPPQKKESSSSSIFGRSPSISFKHSPLPSLRHHKEEQTTGKSPSHFWLKDHFMGKHSPLQKQVKKKGPGGSGIPLRLRGEVSGPHRRVGAHFSPLRKMERPTQHHTFSSDASDVQQIEKKLLQLMDDFETGKLKAFGKDSRLRQMEEIREQQERLARLHFDVGAEQDLYPPLSEDGLKISEKNMKTLMEKLAQLSESIENLHTNTRPAEGKHSNGSHSLHSESNQPSTQSFSPDTLHSAPSSHNTASHTASSHHTASHSSSAHQAVSHNSSSHNAHSHNSSAHQTASHNTSSHHAHSHNSSAHQAPSHNVATSHNTHSHSAATPQKASQYTSTHQTPSYSVTTSHHAPSHNATTSHHPSSQHVPSHSAGTSHHHHHHHHHKTGKTKEHKEQQSASQDTNENVASCASSNKVNALNAGNTSSILVKHL